MVAAERIQRGTLWACGTTAGSCVIRVDGLQTAIEGESSTVALREAVRGDERMQFRSAIRSVRLHGFLKRYKPVAPEAAAELVKASKSAPTLHPHAPTQRNHMDMRQTSIPGTEATAPISVVVDDEQQRLPESRYDAVVLYAGLGGPTLALKTLGMTVGAVDPDPDAVSAHRWHAGPATTLDPFTAWADSVPVKARVMFCAMPVRIAPAAKTEADVAEETDGEGDGEPEASEKGGKEQGFSPLLQRQLAAVRAGAAMGTEVMVLEVGGKPTKGLKDSLNRLLDQAEMLGYRAWPCSLNPAYLGLPRHRPTTMLIALRHDRLLPLMFPSPAPTHGPRGNPSGLPPFRTVRDALSDDPSVSSMHSTPGCMSLDEPCEAFGPRGPKAPLRIEKREAEEAIAAADAPTETPAEGEAPKKSHSVVKVALNSAQVAALQGLPMAVLPSPRPLTKRGMSTEMGIVASAFPPMLAERIVRAAITLYDAAPPLTPPPTSGQS